MICSSDNSVNFIETIKRAEQRTGIETGIEIRPTKSEWSKNTDFSLQDTGIMTRSKLNSRENITRPYVL